MFATTKCTHRCIIRKDSKEVGKMKYCTISQNAIFTDLLIKIWEAALLGLFLLLTHGEVPRIAHQLQSHALGCFYARSSTPPPPAKQHTLHLHLWYRVHLKHWAKFSPEINMPLRLKIIKPACPEKNLSLRIHSVRKSHAFMELSLTPSWGKLKKNTTLADLCIQLAKNWGVW